MRPQIKNFRNLESNQGLISIDFLFGFLLSFAFLMVFFALAYSLTIVEVVQYIAFASSRTYMGADVSPGVQKTNAIDKATSLAGVNKFGGFVSQNWFKMGAVQVLQNDASGVEYFIGVQIPLTIKLLDFKIPFFGTTKTTNSGEGFQTVISSYLIREPTETECLSFNKNRAALLINTASDAHYGSLPNFAGSYVRISDNGC